MGGSDLLVPPLLSPSRRPRGPARRPEERPDQLGGDDGLGALGPLLAGAVFIAAAAVALRAWKDCWGQTLSSGRTVKTAPGGTEPLETAAQRPHVLATRAPAAAWEAGAERSASSVLSCSEFVSSSGRRLCSPPGTLPRLWEFFFLFFFPRAFS